MSLSKHLTSSSAAHGRLAFHPDCPRCAHRLAGQLGGDQLVGLRIQATLTAAVLAFTASAAPAAAIANQVPQPGEGTTDPGPEGPGMAPGFDPGGDDGFDSETAPVPGGQGGGETDDGDGPPVETEPFTDPTPEQIVPDAPADVEPALPPQPAPTTEPPPTAEPPVPPPAPMPAPTAPAGPVPAPKPEATRRTSRIDNANNRSERLKPDKRGPAADTAAPAPISSPAPTGAQALIRQTPTPAETGEVVPVSRPAIEPAAAPASQGRVAGTTYRVRPGDSLWSIARRTLAGGASNGQLAREVARLWRLNEDRIGTGNPSMLHVGTVLRLR